MSGATSWSFKAARAPRADGRESAIPPILFYAILAVLWMTMLAVFYGLINDIVYQAERRLRVESDRGVALMRCDWQASLAGRLACRERVAAAGLKPGAQGGPAGSAELPSLSSDPDPVNVAYR